MRAHDPCYGFGGLEFRLLGPLEVIGDGGVALSIGTGRRRALLALLILRANESVASDRLVDELWGESPPATAQKMLHNQVAALRQALGRNGRLETQGRAYRLNVRPGERDVWVSASLSPDGSRLYAIDTEGEAISFDMSPEAWKRHACLVAGRELSPAEWEEALPDRPSRSVCPGG